MQVVICSEEKSFVWRSYIWLMNLKELSSLGLAILFLSTLFGAGRKEGGRQLDFFIV